MKKPPRYLDNVHDLEAWLLELAQYHFERGEKQLGFDAQKAACQLGAHLERKQQEIADYREQVADLEDASFKNR